ncbi:hypothetical protein P6F26_15690 [Roseibacterium sp. SDUM158017]|uniref:hypothetical protein n=1 Tax=Roseicyclus salinarum TaxID=3036773 RepID=UPI0024154E86|nr:hypothetical protein [Roseibacterium sp. SDUM158017]MDG4649888.1 hypothetical protein [Roseibacterium sp. SDUM158017]
MKVPGLILMISALLALTACETPTRYPVTGEPCSSGDPVLELDARDCVPPV